MKKLEESYLTEQELQQLFKEKFSRVTDTRWICGNEDIKEIYALGMEEILNKSSKCIFSLLEKLNKLPRDNTFWITNKDHTTTIKIYSYMHSLLQENPDDVTTLWAMVGLRLIDADNEFGRHYWKRLFLLGFCSVKQVILAALLAEFTANFTFELMINFIKDTDSKDEALGFLQSLSESHIYDISCWATFVLNRI